MERFIYKRKLNLQRKKDKIIPEWANKRVQDILWVHEKKENIEASKKGVNLGDRGQRIGFLKGTVQID
jgi:hypothetical protein